MCSRKDRMERKIFLCSGMMVLAVLAGMIYMLVRPYKEATKLNATV